MVSNLPSPSTNSASGGISNSSSSEIALIAANSIPHSRATAAPAADSMSTTSALYLSANNRFSSGPLTDETVAITDSPPVAAKRAPDATSIASRPLTTSPTLSVVIRAPAIPADINITGRYFSMTAIAAFVVALRPIPPMATTASSNSKNSMPSERRPRTPFRSGANSRRIAVTTAMLLTDIAIRPEPVHRALQRTIYRAGIPSQLTLSLRAGDKHLLAPHAHRVQRHSRFAVQDPAANQRIHHACGIGQRIWQANAGRRDAGYGSEFIENLL